MSRDIWEIRSKAYVFSDLARGGKCNLAVGLKRKGLYLVGGSL
jgi:hypothetical protein